MTRRVGRQRRTPLRHRPTALHDSTVKPLHCASARGCCNPALCERPAEHAWAGCKAPGLSQQASCLTSEATTTSGLRYHPQARAPATGRAVRTLVVHGRRSGSPAPVERRRLAATSRVNQHEATPTARPGTSGPRPGTGPAPPGQRTRLHAACRVPCNHAYPRIPSPRELHDEIARSRRRHRRRRPDRLQPAVSHRQRRNARRRPVAGSSGPRDVRWTNSPAAT